jgi:hypothetical protein
MSKVKKLFVAIAGAITVLFLKVGKVNGTQYLYGPPREIETQGSGNIASYIGLFICIPLIIIVGIIALIICIKKSKKSNQQNMSQNTNPQVGEQQNQNNNNPKM